jgi:hypothetical protein
LPLAGREISLPSEIRLPVTGGTDVWERSQIAMFGLHCTLSEFEQISTDDQAWAVATWRTRQKLKSIEALEAHRKRGK